MHLIDDDPLLSLAIVAAEVGMHHSTAWHFLRNELKRFSYELKMNTELAEVHKTKGKPFAQHCRREFRNVSEYLERIFFLR